MGYIAGFGWLAIEIILVMGAALSERTWVRVLCWSLFALMTAWWLAGNYHRGPAMLAIPAGLVALAIFIYSVKRSA